MLNKREITFNRIGHDSFIDFIKAYAIICVLFGHTFPHLDKLGYGLWAGMQVPLFVLIQSFHILKKDYYSICFKKLFFRIIVPFALVTLVMCFFMFAKGRSVTEICNDILLLGGYGPGAYYPWIYLQLAFVIPILKLLLSKGSLLQLAILFIIFCEGLEILASYLALSDGLYRLLCVRYLFLVYLGFIWYKRGIVINTTTLLLSLVSLGSIIYFEYFSINDEPLFFNTSWKFHRWPCYYYVSTLLCYLLFVLYCKLRKYKNVMMFVNVLAKCSYEIFLMQMMIITLYPSSPNMSSSVVRFGIRTIPVWLISIAGGLVFNKVYSRVMNAIK